MTTDSTRAQRLSDIRALLDFLDANPDVPIGNVGPGEFCISTDTDEKGMAILREIAAALDVEVTHNKEGTRHEAVRRFGTATYRAFYCSRESMLQYAEEQAWLRERRQAVES